MKNALAIEKSKVRVTILILVIVDGTAKLKSFVFKRAAKPR